MRLSLLTSVAVLSCCMILANAIQAQSKSGDASSGDPPPSATATALSQQSTTHTICEPTSRPGMAQLCVALATMIPKEQGVTRLLAKCPVMTGDGFLMTRTTEGFRLSAGTTEIATIKIDAHNANLWTWYVGQRPETYDVTELVKEIKLFAANPKQEIKFGVTFSIEAAGNVLTVRTPGWGEATDSIRLSCEAAATTRDSRAEFWTVVAAIIPKNQIATEVITHETPAPTTKGTDMLLILRTPDGFDLCRIHEGKRTAEHGTIHIDPKNPTSWTFSAGSHTTTSDVSTILKGLKPFDKNPNQEVKRDDFSLSIEAEGTTLRLRSANAGPLGYIELRPDRSGATTLPASAPATCPASALAT